MLPEDLCDRLAALAETEARTVSNMARVLIQQGVERLERQQQADLPTPAPAATPSRTDRFRAALERQEQQPPSRQQRSRRLRIWRPS